jgi:hypothetical protein
MVEGDRGTGEVEGERAQAAGRRVVQKRSGNRHMRCALLSLLIVL